MGHSLAMLSRVFSGIMQIYCYRHLSKVFRRSSSRWISLCSATPKSDVDLIDLSSRLTLRLPYAHLQLKYMQCHVLITYPQTRGSVPRAMHFERRTPTYYTRSRSTTCP